MSRWFPDMHVCLVSWIAAPVSWLLLQSAMAGPLGMVADNAARQLSIFNADLDIVTASIAAQPGMALGDCAVSGDERLGITTSSGGAVSFIDLRNADSHGDVPISNLGVDMALSPDDRYVVLAGGGALQQPLSVVDLQQRAEVHSERLFADHTSVEFCDNGTLLVTTTQGRFFDWNPDNALYSAAIDEAGDIDLTGARLSSGAQPNNASCAPGSLAGVLLDREGGLTSFTLPELDPVQTVRFGESMPVAATFSRDGRRLFVRTQNSIQTFHFNAATGHMLPAWSRNVQETRTFYGMDQIAMHPDGKKLYVDGGKSMLILDPASGRRAGEITFGDASGICFARRAGPLIANPVVMD
ncbi:MAG: hypothetical protein R3348_02725 [Xanthomonadales bacterium]|nr:hypothetical protein [Xanthomonadales bacterium]